MSIRAEGQKGRAGYQKRATRTSALGDNAARDDSALLLRSQCDTNFSGSLKRSIPAPGPLNCLCGDWRGARSAQSSCTLRLCRATTCHADSGWHQRRGERTGAVHDPVSEARTIALRRAQLQIHEATRIYDPRGATGALSALATRPPDGVIAERAIRLDRR